MLLPSFLFTIKRLLTIGDGSLHSLTMPYSMSWSKISFTFSLIGCGIGWYACICSLSDVSSISISTISVHPRSLSCSLKAALLPRNTSSASSCCLWDKCLRSNSLGQSFSETFFVDFSSSDVRAAFSSMIFVIDGWWYPCLMYSRKAISFSSSVIPSSSSMKMGLFFDSFWLYEVFWFVAFALNVSISASAW